MNTETTPPPPGGEAENSQLAAAPSGAAGKADGNDDSAWVSIDTKLDLETLAAHCRDVEGLLRVNPYLDFAEWTETSPGRYHLKARNMSNNQDIDTAVREEISADGIRLFFESGIKTSTHLKLEPIEGGSRLTITDDYSGTPVEVREARIAEVDKSLVEWGKYLHRYFSQWHKWSWCPPWRWYMKGFWRKMKPMGRRIVFILWIITLFELATILLIAMFFAFGLDRFLF